MFRFDIALVEPGGGALWLNFYRKNRAADLMAKAFPLGTVRLMKRWNTLIKVIKVSHLGGQWERWRPLAQAEAQKQHGPLPREHQVYHLDGDPLNDAPENLLVIRSDRLRLNLDRSREARRNQRRRRKTAVRKTNRLRQRVNLAVRIRVTLYYPVSHLLKKIVIHPLPSKRQVEQFGDRPEFEGLALVPVRGSHLATRCHGYERVIPDEGQAWTWRKNGQGEAGARLPFPAELDTSRSEERH